MADSTRTIAADDLRAAVAAGLVTEAQAASLFALADSRAGRRARMTAEDEPFEFFRGFSEIFVSVGLIILLGGIGVLLTAVGAIGMLMLVPAACAAIAWWWAGYFTLKRRMNLPSMVLASAFGTGVFVSVLAVLARDDDAGQMLVLIAALVAAGAMGLWYRRFRLPFSMFILGGFVLMAVYVLTATVSGDSPTMALGLPILGLRSSPAFSLATLVFGLGAFVAGMWFDTRDPHRLGRHAATGFWLHLLAAPALVNTAALRLLDGGDGGTLLLIPLLVLLTMLALVIDRRSFLTAGIIYIGIVLSWLIRGDGGSDAGQWAMVLILLGALVTALGTWWVPLRAALMRAVPDFPGKSRLPPYVERS